MSKLKIERRPKRVGLYIPLQGNKDNPNLVFPLYQIDHSELDELIRAILEKQGVTDESEIQAIVEAAERDSEVRLKISEAKTELRRLMNLRKQGAKLMQRGFRKWVPAFFPAITQFKQEPKTDIV